MSSISNSSLLLQVAQIDGCETLLKSFRPQYLEYVLERVRTQQEYVSLTPEGCAQKVLEKCKASAAALEKANMLHETMDRRHYEELVRSETAYITRGVDKKKGRKVIFFRTGTFFRGESASGSILVFLFHTRLSASYLTHALFVARDSFSGKG